MGIQDSVLQILSNEGHACISGEAIALELKVSRAAVWKAIQKLQADGYRIAAVSGKGYTLEYEGDPLSERGILQALSEYTRNQLTLSVLQSTESTNEDLKALATQGAPAFTCIVANEQTSGKGRRGRAFSSPAGTGVYLSILLKPTCSLEEAGLITGAAAVAVARALSKLAQKQAAIKWVNDVYIGEKKVCGILTEASADLESRGLHYAVLGIGINAYTPEGGFPAEIATRAGSVFDEVRPNARNMLAAAIIEECISIFSQADLKTFVREYQDLSLMNNKRVQVFQANQEPRWAIASGINDDLSLQVRFDDGSEQALQTGEVSIVLSNEEV